MLSARNCFHQQKAVSGCVMGDHKEQQTGAWRRPSFGTDEFTAARSCVGIPARDLCLLHGATRLVKCCSSMLHKGTSIKYHRQVSYLQQLPCPSHKLLPCYVRKHHNWVSYCSKGLVYLMKRCQAMQWHQRGKSQAGVLRAAKALPIS